MSAWLLGLAFAAEGDLPLAGHVVTGFGGSHGVALDERLVVGGDGGVSITSVGARYRQDEWSGTVRLPFAAYTTPTGRDTNLGKLEVEGFYALGPGPGFDHAVGLSLALNPFGNAYTWATSVDEVWPGAGLDGIWEFRTTELGDTTLLGRGTLGIHVSTGFSPVPNVWPRVQLAGAVDQAVADIVGVTGEVAISHWDVSPVQLSGFARADLVEGLRVRGGLVLPVLTWFGAEPTGRPSGFREATLRLQLAASL